MLKAFFGIVLIAAILVAVFIACLFLYGPEKIWRQIAGPVPSVDIATWPGRSIPNWALSCPSEQDAGRRLCTGTAPTHDSPIFMADAVYLLDRIISRLEADGYPSRNSGSSRIASKVTLLERNDEALTARLEVLSVGLKFPDIVDLQIIELDNGGVSYLMLSRSLIGYSDMGMNARRLERLRGDL